MEESGKIGLPEEFVKKMKGLLKEEWPAFLESYERERSFGLRLNPLKGKGPEALPFSGLIKIPWAEEGYFYPAEERPGRHPLHEAGLYYIQEPSAMAAAEALDPRPGEFVLDLCAAPGGKSTHIAGKLRDEGLLVCNEIHPARARVLSQNIERMGVGNAVVCNEEPARLAKAFPCFFDAVAVDAPCSGEGMFRKDEQARAEWSPDRVNLCAARQDEILESAAGTVRPGGRILYSTCTFSPEENEGTVLRFLAAHPEFSLEKTPVSRFFSEGRPDWAGEAGRVELKKTVRIWPHKTGGEGHFLALLRKSGGAGESECEKDARGGRAEDARGGDGRGKDTRGRLACDREKNGREKSGREKKGRPELGDFQKFCEDTLLDPGTLLQGGRPILFGEQLYRLPDGLDTVDGLKVLRPGLHLGTMKKGRFEPSHALALFLSGGEVLRQAEVGTGELARAYLRGEAVPVTAVAAESAGTGERTFADGETGAGADKKISGAGSSPSPAKSSGDKGWALITAAGCSLGWAKLSGGVYKNHYPKGLRIF